MSDVPSAGWFCETRQEYPIVKRTTYARLTVLVVLLTTCVSCASLGAAVPQQAVPRQSLVIFPLATTAIPDAQRQNVEQYASDLLVLISEGLTASKKYTVITFDERAAAIQRALREQKVTEKEITQPIDTTASGTALAVKLADLLGANVALIGSVDAYQYNLDKGEANVTVTLRMIDVRTGKTRDTTVTGTATRIQGQPGQTELAIGIAASYDAAEKLLAGIASVSSTELTDAIEAEPVQPVEEPAPPKKKKDLIPMMLGAMVLGFLISGGG